MVQENVVILGGGPAGLGAASQLASRKPINVTLLEKNYRVGGNAGSFHLEGVNVDFGSHRLHPSCDPAILADIQELLGDDLMLRPRNGRIRLMERWINFPLRPFNLLTSMPARFGAGVLQDIFVRKFNSNIAYQTEKENFASIMEKGLGRTISQEFYFPYARKLWGLEPSEISATQARRRVKNNSILKMVTKIMTSIPVLGQRMSGRFYYPQKGFGQIPEAYFQSALASGADVRLSAKVIRVVARKQSPRFTVEFEEDSKINSIDTDHLWSTLPISALARMFQPKPEKRILEAANGIKFRAMVLIYLLVENDRFSAFDAHYFPEEAIRISRLSEPKNYSNSSEPKGLTVLCAELPCDIDSKEWNLSDIKLKNMVLNSLKLAELPVADPIRLVHVERIKFAYPIYEKGYKRFFDTLDDWINQIPGLISFGRQGLFAHDNTHHALYMAYSAVDCMSDQANFDDELWRSHRKIFETHVVED